jgi:hypothetical protein
VIGAVTTAVWSFVVVLFNEDGDDVKIELPPIFQELHECYTFIKYIFYVRDNFFEH